MQKWLLLTNTLYLPSQWKVVRKFKRIYFKEKRCMFLDDAQCCLVDSMTERRRLLFELRRCSSLRGLASSSHGPDRPVPRGSSYSNPPNAINIMLFCAAENMKISRTLWRISIDWLTTFFHESTSLFGLLGDCLVKHEVDWGTSAGLDLPLVDSYRESRYFLSQLQR